MGKPGWSTPFPISPATSTGVHPGSPRISRGSTGRCGLRRSAVPGAIVGSAISWCACWRADRKSFASCKRIRSRGRRRAMSARCSMITGSAILPRGVPRGHGGGASYVVSTFRRCRCSRTEIQSAIGTEVAALRTFLVTLANDGKGDFMTNFDRSGTDGGSVLSSGSDPGGVSAGGGLAGGGSDLVDTAGGGSGLGGGSDLGNTAGGGDSAVEGSGLGGSDLAESGDSSGGVPGGSDLGNAAGGGDDPGGMTGSGDIIPGTDGGGLGLGSDLGDTTGGTAGGMGGTRDLGGTTTGGGGTGRSV